ncbi:uncharacterized protein LOC141902043 [Tubulanus polymorphus]|uniref:uncharacterized protein LOC141902043 n=1 Tax=Tubulanus polymorphus TaxID=672921 RepID=UPI003DA2C2CB
MAWVKLFVMLGTVGIILTVWNAWTLAINSSSFVSVILLGGSVAFSFVCFDIARRRPCDSESLQFIVGFYFVIGIIIPITGWWRYRSLNRSSKDVENTQNRLLMKLIANTRDTKYGIDHGFKEMNSVDDFFKTQPLTNYKDYKPYIDYTFETGDLKDVTFKGEVVYYAATSGTTGNNKLFPISNLHIKGFVLDVAMTLYRAQHMFPAFTHLKRPFGIRINPTFKTSPQGLRIGPISSGRESNGYVPYEINKAASLAGEETVLYVHALLVLGKRNTEAFIFTFVGTTMMFMQLLEAKWKQLCTDIEIGQAWSALPLSVAIKTELNALLKPDPHRADELRKEFECGFKDIMPRIWPNAGCIALLTSGSFKNSAELLKKRYFGQIPVVSYAYGSTESSAACLTFVNDETEGNYTPIVDEVFFEFIAIDEVRSDHPPTKRIHQLRLDEEYEVVVTNNRGVYRYRCGDVIKVVGYYNDLPLIDLSYRSGQILNVANEKLTETALAEGLNIAADSLNVSIVEYTSVEGPLFEEVTKITRDGVNQGLYEVIFVELKTKDGNTVELSRHARTKFDEGLMEAQENYRAKRHQGILQPMSVYSVKDGTFSRFRQLVLSSNPLTSAIQFKQPKLLTKNEHIQFFVDNAECD